VRIPKDIYGRDFANHLICRWEFHELRQTGSHIILRTDQPYGLTVSVPAHKPLRIGTFKGLLDEISKHRGVAPEDILRNL